MIFTVSLFTACSVHRPCDTQGHFAPPHRLRPHAGADGLDHRRLEPAGTGAAPPNEPCRRRRNGNGVAMGGTAPAGHTARLAATPRGVKPPQPRNACQRPPLVQGRALGHAVAGRHRKQVPRPPGEGGGQGRRNGKGAVMRKTAPTGWRGWGEAAGHADNSHPAEWSAHALAPGRGDNARNRNGRELRRPSFDPRWLGRGLPIPHERSGRIGKVRRSPNPAEADRRWRGRGAWRRKVSASIGHN